MKSVEKPKILIYTYRAVLLLASVVSIYIATSRHAVNAFLYESNVVAKSELLRSSMIADSSRNNSGIKLINNSKIELKIVNIREYYRKGKEKEIKKIINDKNIIFLPLTVGQTIKSGDERWIFKTKINSAASSRDIVSIASDYGFEICACSEEFNCFSKMVGLQQKKEILCK